MKVLGKIRWIVEEIITLHLYRRCALHQNQITIYDPCSMPYCTI